MRAFRLRRLLGLSALLVGVDFLDELSSGIPFVGSPDVQAEFGVSYARAAGWLLFAIGALGLAVEPPLLLLADRWPRRGFVCGGLAALAGACALAALAPSWGWLVVALLLFGPASGIGVNLSQATLMDAHPEARERMMVRWTFAGTLGDLATPGFLALCAALGGGWRLGFGVAAAALAVYAALLWRSPFPQRPAPARPAQTPARRPGIGGPLRAALRSRTFRAWAVAVLACDLMDEILVAFGALFLRDVVGADLHGRALILTCFVAGGALGLPLADRLLARFPPHRLLAASALGAGVAFGLWLGARSTGASALLLGATGFFASLHYPLAKARAYRALPEGSGAVNAVLAVGGAAMLVVPLLLGVVADHLGLVTALALLGIQPLVVFAVALRARG